jgi:hypothetical protein
MRTIGKLALYAGTASLLAAAAPAAALAHTTTTAGAKTIRVAEPKGFKEDSCTGTVFSDTTLRNVAGGDYLAKSVSSSQAVQYSSTGQRIDGYRDSAGHLIMYICGTNYVYEAKTGANCVKGHAMCVEAVKYTDNEAEWWTRYIKSNNDWVLQTLDPHASSYVMEDPGGSKTSGTDVVMAASDSGNTSQEFHENS